MKRPVFTALLLLHTLLCLSQEELLSEQFIEAMESFQEEDGEQLDVENLFDIINELRFSKLDLNTSTEEEFEQLPFLSAMDARNLVRHREAYGAYQTLYELKHIPDFTQEKINQLLPFVIIREQERRLSFKERMEKSQSQIHLSTNRYLQTKKGYVPDSAGVKRYAGSPFQYYGKYLFTAERLKASFIGEKDAGEAEWSHTGHGFDFVSASLDVEGTKWMKQICLGDYKVNFGQGLVVGTGSILGKNASVTNAYKNTQGIKRYASTGESGFFRGAATTLGWGKVRLTLLGSCLKADATIKEENISSFKTDGMHRTALELEKKRNYTEKVCGTNLSFKHKSLSLGATLLHYHYSRMLQPATKAYMRFRPSETQSHWNTGLNYKARLRHITFYGESAIDAGGHFATLNGAAIYPLSRLEITLAQRYYQHAYQAYYGKGFAEGSRIENEQGIYLSTRFVPAKRLTLSAYVDSYQFPWALYASPTPSSGQEMCVQANVKMTRQSDLTLKYKYKEKSEEESRKRTLRGTLNTQIKRWRIQTIMEGNRSDKGGQSPTYGWIVSQTHTGEIRPLHLSTAFRYAYFQAENYDNRIYIYEKDLPYTLSFPMHYGKGHRLSVSLSWKKREQLQLIAKAGWFIYTDGRTSIGTGQEMMEGNISTQVKFMIKVVIP